MTGATETRGGSVRLWTTLACIAVTLVATVGQALDSCEFLAFSAHQEVSAGHSTTRQSSPCLICIAAHSAPLVSALAHVAPVLSSTEAVILPHRALHSALQVFALHIRPPPSL